MKRDGQECFFKVLGGFYFKGFLYTCGISWVVKVFLGLLLCFFVLGAFLSLEQAPEAS